jgi:serine/threonine-protein kinase HipA
MNGVAIGRLERERSGALSFAYRMDWLERPTTLPISRKFSLREKPYVGQIVRDYFDNLLPDDRRVREQVAARAQAGGIQAFDLLAAVGRDCVGALQFYPEDEHPGPVKPVRGKSISSSEIAELLRNLRVNPLGISRERDFRISLAGAQSKTALLYKNGRWLLPEGATPTTHILKPAIGKIPDGPDLSLSVENEWLCLRLLQAFGVKAANAEIAEFDGIKVLVVERFDRRWSGEKLYRLPQEDICQAIGFGPDMKYESDGGPGIGEILELLNESDHRDSDRRQFMKAQLIFWMIAAIDGHAKNFSLFIRPSGFAMTPLYDVMSAEPHINTKSLPSQKMRLAMSVGKNRHYKVREILPRHWHQTASQSKFDGLDKIIAEVIESTPGAIKAVSKQLPKGFPSGVSGRIFEALEARSRKLLEGE